MAEPIAPPIGFVSPQTPIDLTNCDREPIHIPGAVQPHGVLLALAEPDLRIERASESARAHLGVDAAAIIGRPAGDVLGAAAAEEVRRAIARGDDRSYATMVLAGPDGTSSPFEATFHRSGGLVLVELEPCEEGEGSGAGDSIAQFQGLVRETMRNVESAETLVTLAQRIAEQMRRLTGFDRVWVYRFHEDWHGEIIGEARRDDIETWLGMHYPASDIPAQARALFLRHWVRVIADLHFTPSPLVPPDDPSAGRVLDLGSSTLRSVSPIHVTYLKNMGVTASLVISLIHRGKLWGLISGHHYSGPKRVSQRTRSLCEFLAQALSLHLGMAEQVEDREHAVRVHDVQARLLQALGTAETIEDALLRGPVTMRDLVEASGAAVLLDDQVATAGVTPDEADLRHLRDWLFARRADLHATTSLGTELPAAAAWADRASGLLAASLSPSRPDYLLWFRGEQKQSVKWAGDPRKPVTVAEDGTYRLHPRGSFELWEQETRGMSAPWAPVEVEAAGALRHGALDLLVRRAERIARLNAELATANAQLEESAAELEVQAEELAESTNELLEQREEREQLLDNEQAARREAERANRAKADFLAMMSHELRTPLNAIAGYADLMELGIRGPVTDAQKEDLGRIRSSQRHLLGLINGILNFSKLEAGHVQFEMADVSVTDVVGTVEALIAPQMATGGLQYAFTPCDAVVRADAEKLRQILLNLLSNAVKFTAPGGRITMTCGTEADRVTITVRDTGRGIAPEQLVKVFDPFVQVDRHLTPATHQGVGLGLAISRELARGMKGDLTVESEVGIGSAFVLTLPRA